MSKLLPDGMSKKRKWIPKWCLFCIFAPKPQNLLAMHVVSAREFRSNQSAILRRALRGESVLLTSRVGTFKITPVDDNDTLTDRIARGLREVKLIETGILPAKSAKTFLDEL